MTMRTPNGQMVSADREMAFLDGTAFDRMNTADEAIDQLQTEALDAHIEFQLKANLGATVDELAANLESATTDTKQADAAENKAQNDQEALDRLLVDHVRASVTVGKGSQSIIDECYTDAELAQLFRDEGITKRRHALKYVRQIHLAHVAQAREHKAEAKAGV